MVPWPSSGQSSIREDCGGPGQIHKWGPYYRLGVWGHAPRIFFFFFFFLRFYMLWSVFWGLLRLLFEPTYSTYIPASCRLRFTVSDRKVYDIRGPSQRLRSSQVCNIWSLCQQRKREAKKQACLKSTMDLDWDENNEPNLVCSIVWGPLHWGPRANCPCCPPLSAALDPHINSRNWISCIRLDHALQWFKCVCSKQKCKEFLAFSTQSCPEVRFLIDSTSCSNKESFKHQSRDSSFSWK